MTSTCTNPPELDERSLLLHLDGDAEPEIAAHLETCPHCRNRMLRLEEFQNSLRGRLHRIDCPPPLTLGEYQRGLLDPDARRHVATHVTGCPKCKAELARLAEFLETTADPQQQPGLLERVQVQIARLLGGSGQGNLATAPAGIRGGQDEVWVFEAGDAQVTLRGSSSGRRGDDFKVVGLVTGIKAEGWEVHLWQDGKPIISRSVDTLGNFNLDHIESGEYDLILEGSGQEIHIQAVEFRQ